MKLKHFLPILLIAGVASAQDNNPYVLETNKGKELPSELKAINKSMWTIYSEGGDLTEKQRNELIEKTYKLGWEGAFANRQETGATFLNVIKVSDGKRELVGELLFRNAGPEDNPKVLQRMSVSFKIEDGRPAENLQEIYKLFDVIYNWIAENKAGAKKLLAYAPVEGFQGANADLLALGFVTEDQPPVQNKKIGIQLQPYYRSAKK